MIKLPFLKKSQRPDIQQNQDFLGIVLDPYKVSVVYFQLPIEEPPASSYSGTPLPTYNNENTKICS